MHDGQGKWYPGEPLPRWALGVYWRTDGEPLWRDPALIAEPAKRRIDRARDGARPSPVSWRDGSGFRPTLVITAYEDVPKLLLEEAALPDNVDPLKADLSLPGERARLARSLLAGLDKPAGFVLPLKAAAVEGADKQSVAVASAWESSAWPLRRERLYAVAWRFATGFAPAAFIAARRAARGCRCRAPGRSFRAARRARRAQRARLGAAVACAEASRARWSRLR